MLATLATGVTDRVAAAALGMTPRTFSRRVRDAMRLLGATSRLQAGYLFARSGWVDGDLMATARQAAAAGAPRPRAKRAP